MSTTGPMIERVVTAVLLSLWRRPETTLRELLRETSASLGDVQESLSLLRQRRCLIEQTPTHIRLVATGLPCWRDILEDQSRRRDFRVGRQVKVYVRTGSTNDVAWQFAGKAESDGLLVVADEQSAGRGRLGRVWQAKPEQSILLSVLLSQMPAAGVDRLTLLAGLAAARAIEMATLAATGHAIRVQIKWPNDLLIAGRKLAGILVERRGANVVIGVGINVAQATGDFSVELREGATSLYQSTGVLVDRARVVASLVEQFNRLCAESGEDAKPISGGLAEDSWLAEWKSRCDMLGQRVRVRGAEGVISGLVIDVDPLQGLVLRDDTGATQFLSAQTSTLSV